MIVFNELHYHPAGGGGELEFVELHNQNATDIDLSNWRLEGGITFDFPEGTVIDGHGFLVVAKDPAALAAATGFGDALGPFDGRLADSGERLRLYSNRLAFRTLPQDKPVLPADKLWSVDIQGDGNGGAFGQLAPPRLMNGEEGVSDLGNVWNAFNVPGHDGSTSDPGIDLVDSAGRASPVRFALTGRVSGWSQAGSELLSDYLFVNAGRSAPTIGWQLSGLEPGERHGLWLYGGISRDVRVVVDRDGDGDLEDESGVLAGSVGVLVEDVVAGADGRIIGRAEKGSVIEGNWAGFQLFVQEAVTAPPVGEASDSLDGRRVMDELEFGDNAPWPVGPDGSGFTLAKVDAWAGTAPPENWASSRARNGSPGAANETAEDAPLVFNEATGSVDAAGFSIELVNASSGAVELGGLVVVSSTPGRPEFPLPDDPLSAGGFLVIGESDLGFRPEDNERLFLLDPGSDRLLDAVRIDDRARARFPDGIGPWLVPEAPTFGAPNDVRLEDDIVVNEILYHAYPVKASPGSPPMLGEEREVFSFEGAWRYHATSGAAGLPADWAASSHPVDGVDWLTGPGLLGLETGELEEPIRTELPRNDGQVTYYFETDFELADAGAVAEAALDHFVDDGAVFYLNGMEVGRFNMPDGPVDPGTTANPGVADATRNRLGLPVDALVAGTNRLSIEVHQVTAGSSDFVLGARVVVREIESPGTPATEFRERDEEWLELFNRGGEIVDLGGWTLDGGIAFAFSPGTVIEPGGFLVVARDPEALRIRYPDVAGRIVGGFSGRLGNGGDLVVLRDARGNPADEVRYHDSGRWHAAADGGGSSLELRDPDADNARAEAWSPSDETGRSAWRTYSYEGVAENDGIGNDAWHEFLVGLLDAGEFLLDDVSVIEDPAGTARELIQNGGFQGDAVGSPAAAWRAVGTHGSHGRTVVVDDPDTPGNRCLRVVATGPTEDKHNKLETTLANNARVTAGRIYRITFRARWLTGSNQVNTRLYFNFLQRTTLIDVPDRWGTPGIANSTAESNAGPTFSGFGHHPAVPAPGSAITVEVEADDPDGIAAVRLFYSVNGSSFRSATMSATDGRSFRGTIPGQGAGAVVQFHVRGEDSLGAEADFPPKGPESRALVKVDDGLADSSGRRPNFRVIVTNADRTFLFQGTNRMSNDRMGATIVVDEERVFHDVGLRLKASAFGRYQPDHYGFNIEFDPEAPFRGVHQTISVERSPNLKELLAKHLTNRAGGPSSFYDDVAWIITPTPGDRGSGLLAMARHTETFFEGLFPEESESGTLFNHELLYNPNGTVDGRPESLKLNNPYNHTNGRYDLRDRGNDKEPYRWGFQIRSARDRDDYGPMVALNQAMSLNGTALEAAVEDLIDVDQWMRAFAIMSLNGTDDIYGRIWEHNFRYYARPTDGRIIVLQWDLDRSFQLASSAPLPPGNAVGKLFSRPRFRRQFEGHLLDLVESTFNAEYVAPWATHFTQLTGDSMTGLTGYVTSRSNFVLGQLPAAVPFEISTNGGADFEVAATSVPIEGRAWIDVHAIRVNGRDTAVQWLDDQRWRVVVPLATGPNVLAFEGLNFRGTTTGGDGITVTNSGSVDVATAENTVITEIHYHPAEPSEAEIAAGFTDADDFEFIELANRSATPVDFSGAGFRRGIAFEFAAGTTVPPDGRIVLVADPAAFAFRYGELAGGETVGPYAGRLNNGGESIRLESASGEPISDFAFGDSAPWPASADGDGFSLVRFHPESIVLDPGEPVHWSSSRTTGGAPGLDDIRTFPAWSLERGLTGHAGSGRFDDPDGDGLVNLAEFALDTDPLRPTGGSLLPAVMPEVQVETGGAGAIFTFRRHIGADEVWFVPQHSPDGSAWLDAPEGLELVGSTNNGDGTETVAWRTADGGEPPARRLLLRLSLPIESGPKD